MYVCKYIYISNTIFYDQHGFKRGGAVPKCKLHSSRCFLRGGLENVSLHFKGIFNTLHTKTQPGGRSATNFTFKGGVPKNVYYILAWSPPDKWPWRVVILCSFICTYMCICIYRMCVKLKIYAWKINMTSCLYVYIYIRFLFTFDI